MEAIEEMESFISYILKKLVKYFILPCIVVFGLGFSVAYLGLTNVLLILILLMLSAVLLNLRVIARNR